ncbi:MAG: hypothetical protein GC185_02140 [Alphaproteobacteria bacterium]|nr:hypothetical protein [Alphaproteobacteria bacterium]
MCRAGAALAADNPPMLKNDPKRPVAAIAHDLGVTPGQFVACFDMVNPTPGGNRPESETRVKSNKAALLPCLQKANPDITNEKLDEVMDRYRPGGHEAQVPRQ